LYECFREQTGVLTTTQRESFTALQDLASDIKNKPLLVKNDLLEQSEALVQANLNEHEKTRAVCIVSSNIPLLVALHPSSLIYKTNLGLPGNNVFNIRGKVKGITRIILAISKIFRDA
jgi:hypothetical protein